MAHRGFTSKDAALTINYIGFIYRSLLSEGYSFEALLKNTGLNHRDLNNPDFRCSFDQHQIFATNAMAITGDVHLGPRMAARFNPINAGLPVSAAMSSDVLATALKVLEQYIFLNFSIVSLDVIQENDRVLLHWQPAIDVQKIEYFVLASCLVMTESLLKLILQREIITDVVECADMAMPAPPESPVLDKLISFSVRFNAPFNQLVPFNQCLDQQLPCTDPVVHQNLIRLCERQMTESFFDEGIEAQVRSVIARNHYHSLPIENVATALGLSERSLRRQLSQSETGYKKVLDDVRKARASELLAVAGLSITAIAYDLGFSDPSNFSRSFKRWSGMSPHDYREKLFST